MQSHQDELRKLVDRMIGALEMIKFGDLPDAWETALATIQAIQADPIYPHLKPHIPDQVANFEHITAMAAAQAPRLRALWDGIKAEAEARTGSTVCMEDPPPPGYEGLLRGFVDLIYLATLDRARL